MLKWKRKRQSTLRRAKGVSNRKAETYYSCTGAKLTHKIASIKSNHYGKTAPIDRRLDQKNHLSRLWVGDEVKGVSQAYS